MDKHRSKSDIGFNNAWIKPQGVRKGCFGGLYLTQRRMTQGQIVISFRQIRRFLNGLT